ncbi:MAG: hypothetical protein OXC46_07465, partial [Thaumarchaeota archaeon]|nr:hypothetical protein [Nitrososphaerota archaeon]
IKKLVEIGTNDDSSKSPKEENGQESKCHLDNQNYSLDISLNDINGMSFHLVYQYAVWCMKHDNDMKVMPHEVKQVFHDYLDKKLGEYTISRHAVLGVFFPRFYHMDISLVKNILGQINTSENIWIAFWDGYMSGNTLVMYVFDDLYKLYDQFLNDENLIQNRKLKQPYYSTINHIMMAYLYNFNNVDHSVEKFLNKADKLTEQNGDNESSMKYCIEQLGEIMKDKSNDSKFNKEKLIKLWKRPSISQHDLSKWFENSPLDKKTTISLYLDYIKNYPEKFDLYFVPIDVLCLYVKDFPNEVLDCLEILIDKQANNIIPDKIKDILKLLLNIDNSQIKTKCNRLTKKIEQLEYDWR